VSTFALSPAGEVQDWFRQVPLSPTDRRNIIGDTPWLTRALGDVRVKQLMFPTDPPDGRMLDSMMRRRSRTHAGPPPEYTCRLSWLDDATTSGNYRHDMRRTPLVKRWRRSRSEAGESAYSASVQHGGSVAADSTRVSTSGFDPESRCPAANLARDPGFLWPSQHTAHDTSASVDLSALSAVGSTGTAGVSSTSSVAMSLSIGYRR
jgi:hypothetical protein